MSNNVDLFVIGAGSGGVRAARIAAGHGARVMIAEEYRVGGTCVIRGCVPKKLLVYAARFRDEFEDAAGYGWTLDQPVFDWARLIANKDREIARLEAAYVTTLERAGVTLVRSRAVIEDAHTVRLPASGEKVRAGTILISTGAAPHRTWSRPIRAAGCCWRPGCSRWPTQPTPACCTCPARGRVTSRLICRWSRSTNDCGRVRRGGRGKSGQPKFC